MQALHADEQDAYRLAPCRRKLGEETATMSEMTTEESALERAALDSVHLSRHDALLHTSKTGTS